MALQLSPLGAALPPSHTELPPILNDKLIMLDSSNYLHANGSVKPARIELRIPRNEWIPFNSLNPEQQAALLTVQLATPE